MPITSGIAAPNFSLPDETGTVRSLLEFRGHPVVLYFTRRTIRQAVQQKHAISVMITAATQMLE